MFKYSPGGSKVVWFKEKGTASARSEVGGCLVNLRNIKGDLVSRGEEGRRILGGGGKRQGRSCRPPDGFCFYILS